MKIIKIRYSTEAPDRIYVKGYGFLSFAKNVGKSLSNKYGQKRLDSAKKSQHDLTPRIYVLHKITTALKFMFYMNQKLRPSYQTALNLHKLKISGRSVRERAEQLATGGDH